MGLTTSKRPLSWYDYTFVWCDNTFDERNLPFDWAPVRNIKTCEECEIYFHSIKTRTTKKMFPIILIVHESFSKQIIPRIYSCSKLLAIYIFDPDLDFDEEWFEPYEKVKGAVMTVSDLMEKIESDYHHHRLAERIPLSLFDPNILHRHCTRNLHNEFIHLAYFINRLNENDESSDRMHDLIEYCLDKYRDNPYELKQIRSFRRSYSSKRVLHYFLKEFFLTRLFHRVLQRQDFHQLRFFRFFINDLEQQLRRMSSSSSIRVYKGQWLSKEQWNHLGNTLGDFCSIDDFWLTEMEKKRACRVFDHPRDDLVPVLFKIDADPRLESSLPFANIRSWTKTNEHLVLFMIGSLFQIIDIYQQDHLSIVKLKFCTNHPEQFKYLTDEQHLRSFGHVLMTLGRFQQAETFYRNLMKKYSKKISLRAHCYQKLALIYDEYGDYPASLHYYHKVLHYHSKETNDIDFNLGLVYASLGDVYRKHGDYAQAYDNLDRAINYWQGETNDWHAFELAVCYNNLGIVYEEEEDYDQALDYYLKAYDLRMKYCSYDQISLGISMNNLGGAYFHLGRYDQAFDAYQQALNIYRSSLPDRHPKIASTLNNLGGLYERQGELEKATDCYEQARDIYRSLFRCENANLLKIEINLERVRTKVVSPVLQF